MGLHGIGLKEGDLELKIFNFTEYTTIHKDDLQLIQDTMAFSSDYIGKQDDLIQSLLQTIDGLRLEPAKQRPTKKVWDSIKNQLMDDYIKLQEAGHKGVEMINKQTGG